MVKELKWISIDNFIDREGIKTMLISSMQISKGAETEMLKTTIKHLEAIDYFFISTHGDPIHRFLLLVFWFEAITTLLFSLNTSLSESCSGDGLIVAKRKDVVGPEQIANPKYG